jgi:xylulokinase
MMPEAVLSIDLGTGSVKALLRGRDESVLSISTAGYGVSRPRSGWAEQDPAAWWRATVQSVRSVLDTQQGIRISGIGLTGQMHGTVLLDEYGQVLRPAIIWEDARSRHQVEEMTRLIGLDRLVDITGSPVATGFQAASVRWVQENEPEIWKRTVSVLLPKDFLRWKLSGDFVSEPSDASGTLLFDVSRRDWSSALLALLSIEQSQLPKIVESTAMTGELCEEAASDLGLDSGIPIVAGGGDAPAAALAAGLTSEDAVLLTISTGSQAILPTNQVELDRQGRSHSWCACFSLQSGGPPWYRMGATLASGLALRWLRESIFGLESAETYEQMIEWAVTTPAGAGGLVFLPYLVGERTPHMDPAARGMFLGLCADHGRSEMTRAVMEGATFAIFDAFQALVSSANRGADRIVLAGGGARSTIWRQIVADVFERPVLPLVESEGSAIGAALLAGTALGWHSLKEGATRAARYGDQVNPIPENVGVYQQLLPIFRAAYEKHADDFRALESLSA